MIRERRVRRGVIFSSVVLVMLLVLSLYIWCCYQQGQGLVFPSRRVALDLNRSTFSNWSSKFMSIRTTGLLHYLWEGVKVSSKFLWGGLVLLFKGIGFLFKLIF